MYVELSSDMKAVLATRDLLLPFWRAQAIARDGREPIRRRKAARAMVGVILEVGLNHLEDVHEPWGFRRVQEGAA